MAVLGALSQGVDSRGLVQTRLLCFFYVIVSYKSPLLGDRLYRFLKASCPFVVYFPFCCPAHSETCAPPLTAERMRETDR